MNLLEALHPYVAPMVPGCPVPVIDHNIRLSAIEFCNRTRWHEEEVYVSRLGTSGDYALDIDAGLEILRFTSVSVNGRKLDAHTRVSGLRLVAAQNRSIFFVVKAADQIQINPAPADSDVVHVVAALRPTMTATTLSNALDEWREAIAGGAIAKIALMPGQSFSNPDIAAYHRSLFTDSVQAALVKQGMGSAESTTQRQIHIF